MVFFVHARKVLADFIANTKQTFAETTIMSVCMVQSVKGTMKAIATVVFATRQASDV
jgi:hypothetical protein